MNNSDNEDKSLPNVYGVLSYDENNNKYKVVAVGPPGMRMPILFSDGAMVENTKIVMQEVVKGTGKHIKLFKFTNSELIFEASDKSTH